MRESLAGGLARADAVVVIAGSGETRGGQLSGLFGDRPVLPAVLAPVAGERLTGMRLLAFAGIGRPEKFFATLRRLGAEVIEARAFPDHHVFRGREIVALRRRAERTHSRLATTAKDILRLPPAERRGIEVLEVEIRWPQPEALSRLLTPVLQACDGAADAIGQ